MKRCNEIRRRCRRTATDRTGAALLRALCCFHRNDHDIAGPTLPTTDFRYQPSLRMTTPAKNLRRCGHPQGPSVLLLQLGTRHERPP